MPFLFFTLVFRVNFRIMIIYPGFNPGSWGGVIFFPAGGFEPGEKVDPVHFGLVMIINLLIGTCTPPFGIALFITVQIAQVPFSALVRAVAPFLIPMIGTLLLVTYIPKIVLFPPGLIRN